jgi:hypothetical protein
MTSARAAAAAPTEELRKAILNEAAAIDQATKAARDRAEIEDKIRSVQEEIRTYGLLASAITDLNIARASEMLRDPKLNESETDAIKSQIAALEKLRKLQMQKEGLEALKEFDKFMDPTKAKEFGEAFSKAADSIGKLTKSFQEYSRAQAQNAKEQELLNEAKLKGNNVDSRQEQLNKKIASDQIRYYGDMASAAQGFFEKGSKGYEALGSISKAYHAIELAMAIESTVANIAAGAAKMFAQSGWVGFAGVAAMVAVMASLGFSRGGANANIAQERQASQGTGTVLGDASAKSESMSKSIEDIKKNSDQLTPINASMLVELQGINSHMAGLAQIIFRTAGIQSGGGLGIATYDNNTLGRDILGGNGKGIGTNRILDAIAGGSIMNSVNLIASWWGKSKQSITDSGLSIGGTLSDVAQGSGISQYANIHSESKSAFGLIHNDSDRTVYGAVDATIADQIGKVFKGISDTLVTASSSFVSDTNGIKKQIADFVVDLPNISLSGLKGQALQDALNTVFSSFSDSLAHTVLPGMDDFQQVGEGYFQTIVRIASGTEAANAALERFGISAINFNDIINKQGDVGVEIIKQSIEAVETGSNGIQTGVGKIIDAFDGSVSDLTSLYKSMLDIRTLMGDTNLNGRDLSASTIQGAGGADQLKSGLSAYLDKYFTPQEKAAAAVKDVSAQFEKLGIQMPTTLAGFRALVGSIDASTDAGAKQIGQLLALADPFASALEGATKGLNDLISSLSEFRNSLSASSNPASKTQSSLDALDRAYTASMSGDTKAAGSIEGLAKTYLDAKLASSSSQLDYARGVASVRRIIDNVISATQSQAMIAMQMTASGSMYAGGSSSFNESGNAILNGSSKIPGFTSGGSFGGGWRVVGENGPELEATGPSRIFNAPQTKDILGGGMVAELRALREEVAALRSENNAQQISIALSSAKTAKILDKNDTPNGLLTTDTIPS